MKMGRKFLEKSWDASVLGCLLVFLCVYAQGLIADEDLIILPKMAPEKRRVSPTAPGSDHLDELKERRRDRERAPGEPPTGEPRTEEAEAGPTPSEKRDQKLDAESKKDRPMTMFMQSTLALTRASVSRGRKSYSMDPSALFHLLFRMNSEKKTGNTHYLYGFRMAHIGGTGIYKETPGRFSFLYFGPMISIGKISLAPEADGAQTANPTSGSQNRHSGYLLSTGLSLQSRFVKTGDGEPEGSEDMNKKGIAFDAPGLWIEAQHISLHFGAIQWGPLLGLQIGKGKYFGYLGFSVGGWY